MSAVHMLKNMKNLFHGVTVSKYFYLTIFAMQPEPDITSVIHYYHQIICLQKSNNLSCQTYPNHTTELLQVIKKQNSRFLIIYISL